MDRTTRRELLRCLLGVATLIVADASNSAGGGAEEIVDGAHVLLTRLQDADLASFAKEWPTEMHPRRVEPSAVPALRWLPRIEAEAPEFSAAWIKAFAAVARSLAWRRSYTAAEVGTAFYDNYGWTELLGLTGPVRSEHLACGVLVLGPGVTYPRHRHEADEIYVPLAGTAAWQGRAQRWIEQPPGSVIHHGRYEPHAMRTGADPLLALYLWRSVNLAQKSRLDPPRAGDASTRLP